MARQPRSKKPAAATSAAATTTYLRLVASDDGGIILDCMEGEARYQGKPVVITRDESMVGSARINIVETGSFDRDLELARTLESLLQEKGAQAFAAFGHFWEELVPDAAFQGVALIVSHDEEPGTVLVDLVEGEQQAAPPANSRSRSRKAAQEPPAAPAVEDDDMKPRLLDTENIVFPEGYPEDAASTYWLQYYVTLGLRLNMEFPGLIQNKLSELVDYLATGDNSAALHNKKAVKAIEDFADTFNATGNLKTPAYSKEGLGLAARASKETFQAELEARLDILIAAALTGDAVDFIDSETAASWGCDPATTQPADMGEADHDPQGMSLDDPADFASGLPTLSDEPEDLLLETLKDAARRIFADSNLTAGYVDQEELDDLVGCIVYGKYELAETADSVGLTDEQIVTYLSDACEATGMAIQTLFDAIDAAAEDADETRMHELLNAVADELTFLSQEETC